MSQDLHSAYGIQPPEFRHHTICRSDCKRFGAADNDWAYPPKLKPLRASQRMALNMVLLSHLAGLPVLAERNRYSIQLHSSSLTSYRLAMYLSSFAMIISHFCETLSFQIRPSMGYKRSICPATVENKYQ